MQSQAGTPSTVYRHFSLKITITPDSGIKQTGFLNMYKNIKKRF